MNTGFRSDEKTEVVRLEQKEMEFLYNDGTGIRVSWNTTTYDQISLTEEIMGDTVKFLVPNTKCNVNFHEATPLSVSLPQNVDLKIIETDPKMKGATVSASLKPATLETGAIIQVPQFIENGEVVRVDTHDRRITRNARNKSRRPDIRRTAQRFVIDPPMVKSMLSFRAKPGKLYNQSGFHCFI